MITVSLSWDTRERWLGLKWNGFLSLGLKGSKVLINILGLPIPFSLKRGKTHFHVRWVYSKEVLSFLTKWRLKKLEGTISFSDPMINGLLYGFTSAIEKGKADRRINVTINFLGENWCRGEFIISLSMLFNHLRRWILLFFWKTRRGGPQKGGGS
jgi:hypothetical protein